MRYGTRGLMLVTAVLVVAGCQGVKQGLGIGTKRPPDEFAVYSRAPLSMPPDFAVRPPAQATGASQAAAPRQIARQAMLGSAPATADVGTVAGSSPGIQALLQRTGAARANADVRAQVNGESRVLADTEQSFVERLMFWSKTPDNATVVDARQEARRIQENQALDKPLTEGETPTIRRKPKALLEGIF